MELLPQILLATFIISLLSLIGSILLIQKKLLTTARLPLFVSFAAGVMLSTAFLDLIPESLEHAQGLPLFESVLAGIVTFFFLERFVLWFHHHDDMHGEKPSNVLIIVGDGLHNIFDGVAIAAAFLLSPELGITATIAIAAHEIPHEIADFTILVHGGMSRYRALYYNFISALTAFIGAIGGYYYLSKLEPITPLALAFSAGMFIYIACSDLIPEMHTEFRKQKKWKQSLPFLAGLLVSYLIITFIHH